MKNYTTLALTLIVILVYTHATYAQQAYMVAIGMEYIDTKAYKKLNKRYSNKATEGVSIDMKAMEEIAYKNSFEFHPICNKKATKSGIINLIKSVGEKVKEGDYFLLYFSGHGDTIKDLNGDEKATGYDEVLVAYDTFLVDDIIDRMFRKYFSKTKNIMIVDACHSGTSYKMAKNDIVFQYIFHDFRTDYKAHKLASNELALYNKSNVAARTCLYQNPPSITEPYNLVYFGASTDETTAIGSSHGSLMTNELKGIIESYPYLDYRELACMLRDNLLKEQQLFQYHEVGKNVSKYANNTSFKTD